MKRIISTLTQRLQTDRSVDWVIILFAVIAFVALTSVGLDKSIWFDEAFSAYIIQFDFAKIAEYTATDVHPPFYYWLLKCWTLLFGVSDIALRSISILFGIATIVIGYLLVRRLFGRRAGLLSVLFLTISPMLIRYGQEARMYLLATAIVFAATYVLTYAVTTRRRLPWIVYGLLVGLGMWTHYFTALAWISHFVWRFIATRVKGDKILQNLQAAFGGRWFLAYAVAVVSFVPWLPLMYAQLSSIQSSGFWIGPVGIDTGVNYLSNVLLYLQHDQTTGWLAVLLLVTVAVIIAAIVTTYRKVTSDERRSYWLLLSLAVIPVIVLFAVSLPPFKPSFVDRYLIPAVAALMLLIGTSLAIALRHRRALIQISVVVLVAITMVVGISNVYYYGNFNKNSNINVLTKQLVAAVKQQAPDGQPIIANSPWTFYEATFYNSSAHPIYFIDQQTEYIYGSLDMLKDNDQHKIKDLTVFANRYPIIWYIGYTENGDDLVPPPGNWELLQSTNVYDPITGSTRYRAGQYRFISG